MSGRRCETCRWWGVGLPWISTLGHPIRMLDEVERGRRVCALTIAWGDGEFCPKSLAHSEDYDGDPRGLWTAPEFYCNQWDAKA